MPNYTEAPGTSKMPRNGENQGKWVIAMKFHAISGFGAPKPLFCGKVDFREKSMKNLWKSIGFVAIFSSGQKRTPFSPEKWNFMKIMKCHENHEISWNFMIFHDFPVFAPRGPPAGPARPGPLSVLSFNYPGTSTWGVLSQCKGGRGILFHPLSLRLPLPLRRTSTIEAKLLWCWNMRPMTSMDNGWTSD